MILAVGMLSLTACKKAPIEPIPTATIVEAPIDANGNCDCGMQANDNYDGTERSNVDVYMNCTNERTFITATSSRNIDGSWYYCK